MVDFEHVLNKSISIVGDFILYRDVICSRKCRNLIRGGRVDFNGQTQSLRHSGISLHSFGHWSEAIDFCWALIGLEGNKVGKKIQKKNPHKCPYFSLYFGGCTSG